MHPLQRPPVVRAIERAVTAHLGRPWRCDRFTDLDERASHSCGLLHGPAFSVFAKLDPAGSDQFTAELRGLELIRRLSPVRTALPVAEGIVRVGAAAALLLEAVPEVPAEARTAEQWRSIGRTLAMLHQVRGERFGLAEFDGFFGPLGQDNRPVPSARWIDFYAERRLTPLLRSAIDAGHLPAAVAAAVGRLIERLPRLGLPEPVPSLLHGDAQQNNLLTGPDGPVLIDVAPFFGHPEIDLALTDYFAPVPGDLLDGYRDVTSIDPGFAQRRELWRLFGYLAVITVDGSSAFGRSYVTRIAGVAAHYR